MTVMDFRRILCIKKNKQTKIFYTKVVQKLCELWYFMVKIRTISWLWFIAYGQHYREIRFFALNRQKIMNFKKLKECFVQFSSAVQWRSFRASKGHLGSFWQFFPIFVKSAPWTGLESVWTPLSILKKARWHPMQKSGFEYLRKF